MVFRTGVHRRNTENVMWEVPDLLAKCKIIYDLTNIENFKLLNWTTL